MIDIIVGPQSCLVVSEASWRVTIKEHSRAEKTAGAKAMQWENAWRDPGANSIPVSE